MCPENNFRIFPLAIPNRSLTKAVEFCKKLKSRIFSPDTVASYDYFIRLTSSSVAMDRDCSTGQRNWMWSPIVKYLSLKNESIPEQVIPMDDVSIIYSETGKHGINMYNNKEFLRTLVKVHEKLDAKFNDSRCFEQRFALDSEQGFCEYYEDTLGPDRSEDLSSNGIENMDEKIASAYRILIWYANNIWNYGMGLFFEPVDEFGLMASSPICTPCETDTVNPVMSTRGLCLGTFFDDEYTLMMSEDGYATYMGKKNSMIKFNFQNKLWEMNSFPNPQTTATSKALFGSLLLGRHTWSIVNDECGQGTQEVDVKLSMCTEGEFTCSNGHCVDIARRCDSAQHCDDWSDEVGCKTVTLPDGYLKEFSPIGVNKDLSILKVDVVTDVTIKKIVDIFEKESSIGFKFNISFTWNEKRVIFENLKDDMMMNKLSAFEKTTLWVPKLVFQNTLNEEKTVVDEESDLLVKKMGGFEFAGTEMVDESRIYKGHENPLIYKRSYLKTFECQYDMALYPFDTQKCSIIMELLLSDQGFINLIAGDLNILMELDMMQYTITKWELKQEDSTKIVLTITMGRKILSQILTVYLPTILIIIVVYSTNFLKKFFFEAIVSVNLTAMLGKNQAITG